MTTLKARIPQKTDTQANWEKAINFIPLKGEVIFYEPDSLHPKYRMKIGDGETAVNNLPFVLDEDYILSYIDNNLNQTANAIQKEIQGEVLSIKDFSPTQKYFNIIPEKNESILLWEEIQLRAYGKNLFDPKLIDGHSTESSYVMQDTLFVGILNVTSADYGMPDFKTIVLKPNTQYAFSCLAYTEGTVPDLDNIKISFVYEDGTKDSVTIYTDGETGQFQDIKLISNKNKNIVNLIAELGSLFGGFNLHIKNIQLEVNNEVTSYENYIPYSVYSFNDYFKVQTIYPLTTILTEVLSTTIKCKYSLDTKIAINNIINTIDINKPVAEASFMGLYYYNDAGIIPSPKEWFNFVVDNNTARLEGMSDLWQSLEDNSKYDNIIIPYENEDGILVTCIGGWYLAGFQFTNVIIPNTVTTIEGGAFFAANHFKSIIIPDSVTSIGEEAFDSTVTIICSKGSYAESYAKENGYKYAYDTIIVDDILDIGSENPVLNKVIKTELDKKLDESRINLNGENDITESWGINIEGRAIDAITAVYAQKDSADMEFTNYTSSLYPELNDDKSLKITEWTSVGQKDSELPNYKIATAEYVDDTFDLINGTKSGIVADEIDWAIGAITVPSGEVATTNTARAHTPNFIKYDNSVVITIKENVQTNIFFYTNSNEASCLQNQQVGWLTNTVNLSEYIPEGAEYFRISARFISEDASNGVDLTDNINLISDNIKIERYYEKKVIATLDELNKKTENAIKTNNHFYKTVDFNEILNNALTLNTNYVTYISGTTELESLTVSFDTTVEIEGMAQETVLILDFTNYTINPIITFDGTIKWMNAEVPIVEKGNIYMFSFTHIRNISGDIVYSLGVGGEFA